MRRIKEFFQEIFTNIKKREYGLIKIKVKRSLFGMKFNDGLVYKIIIYMLLISFSYIYLYPILYMLVNSLKNLDDLINPGVKWIPSTLYFENYVRARTVLQIPKAIFETSFYVLKVAILATFTSSIVGYGFARFNFPFKKLLFALMLITFILPPQVTMVAIYPILRNLGIIQTQSAMTIPTFLGQGINSAIYILIFYQFFRTIPRALDESAQLDGASHLRIFRSIAIPLAIPSIIIVFLFSFVWTWNETFITGLYVGKDITLPLKLMGFVASYQALYQGTPGAELNEAIRLAGNMITIMPLLILYFIMQRWFVESIDRTGITGE